jgi:hypothetical protein
MDILQWWPLPDSDICFLLFAYRVEMVVVLAEEAATGPATTNNIINCLPGCLDMTEQLTERFLLKGPPATTNNLLAVDNFLRTHTHTSLHLKVY